MLPGFGHGGSREEGRAVCGQRRRVVAPWWEQTEFQ